VCLPQPTVMCAQGDCPARSPNLDTETTVRRPTLKI
jgi:hypothetical protein